MDILNPVKYGYNFQILRDLESGSEFLIYQKIHDLVKELVDIEIWNVFQFENEKYIQMFKEIAAGFKKKSKEQIIEELKKYNLSTDLVKSLDDDFKIRRIAAHQIVTSELKSLYERKKNEIVLELTNLIEYLIEERKK